MADLLVYAINSAANHPTGTIGIIDLHSGNGSATIAYADTEQGMSAPQVIRQKGVDTIRVNAPSFTANDAACCPVRSYTQTIGRGASGVSVLTDDRPWAGMWIARPIEPGPAVVVLTASGSPASAVLKAGDRITGVDGSPVESGNLGLGVLSQIAKHHPSDRVKLAVDRGDQALGVEFVLGSVTDAAARRSSPPIQFRLGIAGVNAPADYRPGVIVSAVDGPAGAAGIAAGDEITAIGPTTVNNITDLVAGLLSTQGEAVTISYIKRTGERATALVRPQPVDPNSPPILIPAGI